jgi:hypothetical protein
MNIEQFSFNFLFFNLQETQGLRQELKWPDGPRPDLRLELTQGLCR